MNIKGIFFRLLVSLILLLTIGNNVAADSTVSGIINTDTTWSLADSPYVVTGNVLVSEDVTLTIEQGVEVKFETGVALQVRGTLIAIGTSDNMITFTSNQPSREPGDWAQIYFYDRSIDASFDLGGNYTSGSILEYCTVEYAGVLGGNSGAVVVDAAYPFINHCTIWHNKGSGVFFNGDKSAELRISNNTISHNSGRGISATTAITILNNTISHNLGGGIYVLVGMYSAFYPTPNVTNNIISNNTISNNTANDGGGIYAESNWSGPGNINCSISITNNTISNNTANDGGGINSSGPVMGSISNNIISYNTATGNGGGINGSGSNNIISYNTATGNGGGINGSGGPNNSIIRNSASNGSAIYNDSGYDYDFNYNIITGNISTGTDAICTVYVNSQLLFNYNNIFDNTATYECYYAKDLDSVDMNAENNWWGTDEESEIQAKIYDWFDDGTKGFVDYSPFLTSLDTTAPISPPSNLTVIDTDIESITIQWDANQESDIAGYKVYWDTDGELPYENVVDVGTDTTYTITGVDPANYYVGVTAYDNDYDASNDDPDTIVNENQTNGNESWYSTAAHPSPINGYLVTSDLWIRAVIQTEEKGAVDAVWQKGGEDTTSRGDRVIWGHFYANPSDVTWGSENNPDLFVKIWFDVSGRVDVNYFHVSVPDIEVYSDYPYDGTVDEQGTTTMSRRYIRQYYENGESNMDENYEDGVPAAGYSQTGNPSGYPTINDLRIGSMINTEEKGPIDAVWRLGGQDTTARGDQVVWGLFYASPSDVTWGSQDNPDLFVKIWFDVSGRVDVNFFHVSVPDIEVYSDLPSDGTYDQKGTTIMDNRYIRHEYWR